MKRIALAAVIAAMGAAADAATTVFDISLTRDNPLVIEFPGDDGLDPYRYAIMASGTGVIPGCLGPYECAGQSFSARFAMSLLWEGRFSNGSTFKPVLCPVDVEYCERTFAIHHGTILKKNDPALLQPYFVTLRTNAESFTGTLSFIDMTQIPSSVPIPASALLLLSGIGALSLRRRRTA